MSEITEHFGRDDDVAAAVFAVASNGKCDGLWIAWNWLKNKRAELEKKGWLLPAMRKDVFKTLNNQ